MWNGRQKRHFQHQAVPEKFADKYGDTGTSVFLELQIEVQNEEKRMVSELKLKLKLSLHVLLITGTYSVLVRELEGRRKSNDIGVSITHDLFTAVVYSTADFVQLFLAG